MTNYDNDIAFATLLPDFMRDCLMFMRIVSLSVRLSVVKQFCVLSGDRHPSTDSFLILVHDCPTVLQRSLSYRETGIAVHLGVPCLCCDAVNRHGLWSVSERCTSSICW